MPTVWLVIPCYNEEQVLPITIPIITRKMNEIKEKHLVSDYRIAFVDDGSRDSTWEIISNFCCQDNCYLGIKLSRNKGHQNALIAGMMHAKDKCDCVITLDADLQDDIDVIEDFIAAYNEGNQIVYGVRSDRSTDTVFKRNTAQTYYKLLKAIGVETVYNHADYRLVSRQALNELDKYKETNLYLRGIIPQLGFKSTTVPYSRNERVAGKTKYTFAKMLGLAFDGITSFSIRPVRFIAWLGIICAALSVIGLIYALVSYFAGSTVPGWTAIVCSIFLIGGIQLLALGVIGEYIGKIFTEVKGRPRYIIEEILNDIKTK